MGDSTRPTEGSVGCSPTPPDVSTRRKFLENGYVEGCPFSRSNGMKPFSVAGTTSSKCYRKQAEITVVYEILQWNKVT